VTTTAIVPGTTAAGPVVQTIAAQVTDAANFANSVTGLYGLSGSGKSSLADTAAIYAWRRHRKQTLAYTVDLGGYGTKRLALIRAGIMFCYDPRNHVNPFETMELISQGAFPAYLLPGGDATQDERDRGWAPPTCELVLPVRKRYQLVCPNGHRNGAFYSGPEILAAGVVTCACGHLCSANDPSTKIEEQTVRSAGFANIGHRIYDSMTAMNEWGMGDLQKQSAAGMLPSGQSGGSVLGGADALVSGSVKYGTSSKGQYGFVQNRSHDWIANIKAIGGHVVPPTMTFMVEMSKGDDESGGQPVFGPKIAGNARTSSVPGWLGNCLHAVREPQNPATPDVMVHRLWLRNHVDALDLRRVPYLAKTRGVPAGMPDYLEDPPNAADQAWSRCSLDVLYELLGAQVPTELSRLQAEFPDAPAFVAGGMTTPDEVVMQQAAVAVPVAAGGPGPRMAAGVAGVAAAPKVAGNRPRVSQPAPNVAVAAPTVAVPAVPQAAQATAPAPVAPPVPTPPVAAPPRAGRPAVAAGTVAPGGLIPTPGVAGDATAPVPTVGAAPAGVVVPQPPPPVVAAPAAPAPPSPPAPPVVKPATGSPTAQPAGRRTPRPPV
jgi:hypothetical protein